MKNKCSKIQLLLLPVFGFLALFSFVLLVNTVNASTFYNQTDSSTASPDTGYSTYSETFGTGYNGILTNFAMYADEITSGTTVVPTIAFNNSGGTAVSNIRIFSDSSCTNPITFNLSTTKSLYIVDIQANYYQQIAPSTGACLSGAAGLDLTPWSSDYFMIALSRLTGLYWHIYGTSTHVGTYYCDYSYNNYPNGASGACGSVQNIAFLSNYISAYCGDSTCNGGETCTTCPGDCGTCPIGNPYTGDPGTNGQLFYFQSPYQCDISSTCKINYSYNKSIITPYDYLEVFQMSDDQLTSTSLGTSTIEEPNGIFQDKVNGLSNIILSNNPTSTKTIYYQTVAHLAAYYDPTLNQNVSATTTPGTNFRVVWSGQLDVAEIIKGIKLLNATTTPTTTILGLNAHTLACSEEKWNSVASTTSWWGIATNPTIMTCVIAETGIDIALRFTNIIKTIVDGAMRVLGVAFPFDVPIQIKKSWDDATITTLPTELSFLAIGDTNGNIDLSIPPLYTSGTSTTWHVWGPNLWGNTGAINTMLANWRILTKYLLWAAWILLGIFGLAEIVLKKVE